MSDTVHPPSTIETVLHGLAEQSATGCLLVRDPEGDERVTVWDREATLVLWAPDYDGTNKAWVRFADRGDAIVGGSQVRR